MIGRMAAWSMRGMRHHTLIFHRVLPEQDPMSPGEPTVAWFRRLIRLLADQFEVISLEDALQRSDSGQLSGRSVSITFDDGYADNFTQALPVLEEFGVPATFFVTSGYLDGGRMWNDSIIETCRELPPGTYPIDHPDRTEFRVEDWDSRRKMAASMISAWKHLPPAERQAKVDAFSQLLPALPNDLMMSTPQLQRMASSPSASIGGHTVSHPILLALPSQEARNEIQDGKSAIEEKIQRELKMFAYPNGKYGDDFSREHMQMVADAGFDGAVATDWGTLDQATDRFAIPRFTPWQRNLSRFCVDLARCHHGML